MTVDWSERATSQLEEVRRYYEERSPDYATQLVERIVRKTEDLALFPHLGAEVPEYGNPKLREVYEHPYRILYRLRADRVEIVTVIHSSREMPRRPPR